MFDSIFDNIRKTIDQVEKSVDLVLAKTRTKPHVYSTAASYLSDGDRRLTSAVIIARDEESAKMKLRVLIANNSIGKKIEYVTMISNKISANTLDRIKKDC